MNKFETSTEKNLKPWEYGYRGLTRYTSYDIRDKDKNVSNQINLMLDKSLNMFEWHGLPDTVPERELERMLQTSGYVGWVENDGDIYAVWGGLGGQHDAYYRPTIMTVANPGIKTGGHTYSKTLTIGDDVVLMRNDDNLVGLLPIYQKYATLMNEAELTLYINLINKRSTNIITASDDNTASSAKKYLEQLEEGNVGYIQTSKLYDSLQTSPFFSQSNANNTTELTELLQYLEAKMLNEIGLNANWNMKRERLTAGEVEMNSETLYPMVDNMLYNRRLAVEEINEKYGTNVTVEFNSSWDYRLGDLEDTGETPMEYIEEMEEHAMGGKEDEADNRVSVDEERRDHEGTAEVDSEELQEGGYEPSGEAREVQSNDEGAESEPDGEGSDSRLTVDEIESDLEESEDVEEEDTAKDTQDDTEAQEEPVEDAEEVLEVETVVEVALPLEEEENEGQDTDNTHEDARGTDEHVEGGNVGLVQERPSEDERGEEGALQTESDSEPTETILDVDTEPLEEPEEELEEKPKPMLITRILNRLTKE